MAATKRPKARHGAARAQSQRSAGPHPSKTQLQRIYASLRRKPNVVACYLGFKQTGGRRRKAVVIVCLVSEKISKRGLRPHARIPETVAWTDRRGGRHEIGTDVVPLRGEAQLCAASCGPGDQATVLETGSVGMAIDHPEFGRMVTTAGHCALNADEGPGTYDFRPQPRSATLTNVASGRSQPGEAIKAVCTVRSDYALIRPSDSKSCTNHFRDGSRISAPAQSDPRLGSAVRLLTSTGEPEAATVTGIHAEMPIGRAGRMFQLILTTPVLIGGDSGGLLVTADGDALGLAIGFVPVDSARVISVFMRADVVLNREGAEFI